MATFTTATYTAQDPARANPSRLLDKNIASGDVEFAIIPYVLAGTEAANDVIDLCILPAGVIPIPQLSKCTCDTDPGTALTLKVGTAASSTGWAAAVAMTVPGDVAFCVAGATQPVWLPATPLAPDVGSGNAVVFATITTATALTAGAIVYFLLAYKKGR